jgi:hypothetical protein
MIKVAFFWGCVMAIYFGMISVFGFSEWFFVPSVLLVVYLLGRWRNKKDPDERAHLKKYWE